MRSSVLLLGERDVGICSCACGGDILFAEEILDHNLPLRVYLPFDESTFLDKSVNFADDRWPDRYRAVVARAKLFVAPEVLGELAPGVDPYERTNLWMLRDAKRIGTAGVSFICVWNGEGGRGPGGTKHMMDACARPVVISIGSISANCEPGRPSCP